MRRIRFSAAMSLDGYIAGPKGEIDWIVMEPDIDFNSFLGQFDTVLMGRKSYEAAKQLGGGAMPGMQTYIFSHTLQPADCPGAIVSDNPKQIINDLKNQAGKDIWLFGGGLLFCSLLEMGLVDSVEVAVIPVLLGGGLPLLPHYSRQTKLRLVNHMVYKKTGTVSLEYAPA